MPICDSCRFAAKVEPERKGTKGRKPKPFLECRRYPTPQKTDPLYGCGDWQRGEPSGMTGGVEND